MKNNERYMWIDSVKGFSILGVMLIHSGGMEVGGLIGKISQYGSSFVQAFFVISAFLTWRSLHSSSADMTFREGINWSTKRLKYLAPAYYVSIILYLLINGGNVYWAGDMKPSSVLSIVVHILFLHGLIPKCCNSILGVEWYIGVLALFYLVAPHLYKRINSLLRAFVCFAVMEVLCSCICVFMIGRFADNEYRHIYEAYFGGFGFVAQLPSLMLGVILFYFSRIDIWPIEKWKRNLLSYSGLLMAVLFFKSYSFIHVINISTFYSVVYCLFMLGQTICESVLMRFKPIQYIGKQSYAVYLFHCLFFGLYDKYVYVKLVSTRVEWALKFVAVLMLSLFISYTVDKIRKVVELKLKGITECL